jgi:hypothetical protein
MRAPPWCSLSRLTPTGERKADTTYEDSTRADLLGDRRTRVGRGIRMWKRRGGSPASAEHNVVSRYADEQHVTYHAV